MGLAPACKQILSGVVANKVSRILELAFSSTRRSSVESALSVPKNKATSGGRRLAWAETGNRILVPIPAVEPKLLVQEISANMKNAAYKIMDDRMTF